VYWVEKISKEQSFAVMDFAFIGGSMGAVVEKISKNKSLNQTTFFCNDLKIRWARMMEAYSLMQ
jgi:acetyl-CoA carboxylase beta subunit